MKLSLCIVGCGRYADVVLNEIHEMTDDFDFYFASRDLQKAREYCERFGGIDYFGTYEEALSDSRVEAAYFFTPHHVHLENTELAAQQGKHILMEKPIARTVEESQALVKTAQDAGVQLMVAENYRFLHTTRRAKSMIETGTLGSIGDLRLIDIKVEAFRPPPTPWRLDASLTGGGSFIDAGIHYIDLIVHLGGMPTQIYAAAPTKVHRSSQGEDGLVLLANLPNDAVAVFNFSRATSRNVQNDYVGITGTKGYIEFEPYGREIAFENTLVKRNVRLPEAHRGAREMVREFRDCVQQQRPPLMTGDEAIKDLAVVLAAYRSAAESRHVPMSEFDLDS